MLLIGDDEERLYKIDDVELGSTIKDQKSCFTIYQALKNAEVPSYKPSFCEPISVLKIFVHTRKDAYETKGFHVTSDDLSDKINAGLARYEQALRDGVKKYNYRTTCQYCRWYNHTSAQTLIVE